MPGTPRDIAYLESKFETGDIPTQQDFYDLFASFVHYLKVVQTEGSSTTNIMSQKAVTDALTALKDGVPTEGDTLSKLYNLIISKTAIADFYPDITSLLADQGNQENDSLYWVEDATDDPNVDSGWAIYRKIDTTADLANDYVKVQEQEGLDIVINDASTSQKGIVQLATDADAVTGTDDTLAITPSSLTGKLNHRVWTPHAATEANTWRSICYGKGLFVAVSENGTNRVMTSPDGINWTARNAAEANQWRGVTFGNGLFVAVANSGTNRVMTSPDGINWTARSASEASGWNSVVYGNGLFVAVAASGTNRVMTSPDGITWTSRSASDAALWSSVAYGKGLFVAVATSGVGTDRIMSSPDGITWTARATTSCNFITYGNGLFVATREASSNRILTSPDGITWTVRSDIGETVRGLAYGNGLYVTVASSGTNRVYVSSDGINWKSYATEGNSWIAVAYGNGLFVAVAQSGTNRVMRHATSTHDYLLEPPTATVPDASETVKGVVELSDIDEAVAGTANNRAITPITLSAAYRTAQSTGDINFSTPRVYGTNDTPLTGNLTHDLTNARLGFVQKIYHEDSAEPAYPSGWVKLFGDYVPDQLNIIFAEFCGSGRVEYFIIQATSQDLRHAKLVLNTSQFKSGFPIGFNINPAADEYIDPISATLVLNQGSEQFDFASGDIRIEFESGGIKFNVDAALINAVPANDSAVFKLSFNDAGSSQLLVDEDIEFKTEVASTDGNGNAVINLTYRILKV